MTTVAERMAAALNAHDLDAFVSCFDPQYRSEQPLRPGREFVGNDRVRANWQHILSTVPDLKADLVNVAVTGDGVELTEWSWSGTQTDGSPFSMKGMVAQGIRDGKVMWARLYLSTPGDQP